MAKRGRVSMESLMISDHGLAAERARPDAPYDLDDEEAAVWRDVVDSMPADHFIPANYHILTLYCRHVVEDKRLAQITKDYRKKRKDFNYKIYAELQKAALSQTLMIQRLSRSMRLTQQSNFNQKRRLPGPTIDDDKEYPWNFGKDEKW
jgi:hypothetical protein